MEGTTTNIIWFWNVWKGSLTLKLKTTEGGDHDYLKYEA